MAGDSDWSSVPADLLDLVSGHLATERDHLHVRQVCTHWRASVTSRLAAPFRPWVIASSADPLGLGSIGKYSLWLPDGVGRIQVSSPTDLPYCCGTSRGWLVLADDKKSPTQLVLWEPCSGTRILLPPLARVIQVFLSADPLSSSDWMAVATQEEEKIDHNLLYWRPGEAAWTAYVPEGETHYTSLRIHSAAFHAGKMYCANLIKRIAVYDLSQVAALASPPPMIVQRLLPHYSLAAHFVTFSGSLLLVLLFHNDSTPLFPEVYKVDPRDITPSRLFLDLQKSERVKDLGAYSLFLGRGDSFALSAEEHPTICRNCIYYVGPYAHRQKKQRWALVFDLESEVLEAITFPAEDNDNSAKGLAYS
ncbi:unnamed protein product [Urochloa decumbens]|uniref:KIB1-4 beta-propeller domain-containing protein n=1 Tax=Urochloa decumbens TaxID=240449 RepID=A0ABC8XCR1_9POAL